MPVIGADGKPVTDEDGKPVTETQVVKQATWLGAMKVSNVMLARFVVAWTLDVPIPSQDPEGIDHALDDVLDLEDYDHLAEVIRPIVSTLWVDAKPKSLDPNDGSPTTPSNA